MARTNYASPLDVVREINDRAMRIEELVAFAPAEACGEGSDLEELISKVEQRHPLLNKGVEVSGTVVSLSMDGEGTIHPLSLPVDEYGVPTEEKQCVRGTYFGLGVRPVYSPHLDRSYMALCHLVQTGAEEKYLDEYYCPITKLPITHVWVPGSEVLPILPLDAHSMTDLHGDPFIRRVNQNTFEGERSIPAIIKKLGEMTNRALRSDDEFDPGRMQQRVSYINSLELLNSVVISARDVIIGDRDDVAHSNQGDMLISDMSNVLQIRARMFDILPGYKRHENALLEFDGRGPELYAVAEFQQGSRAFMPVKDIIAINAL